MNKTRHINLTVSGRVQNVGFRYFCKEAAQRCGITGFACNRPDGSVYIEAEGTDDELEIFIQKCIKGPVWAKVTDYDIKNGEVVPFSTFSIKKET